MKAHLASIAIIAALTWGVAACRPGSSPEVADIPARSEPATPPDPPPPPPPPKVRIVKAEFTTKQQKMFTGMRLGADGLEAVIDKAAPLRGSTFLIVGYEITDEQCTKKYKDDDFSVSSPAIKTPPRVRAHASRFQADIWVAQIPESCSESVCSDELLFSVPRSSASSLSLRLCDSDWKLPELGGVSPADSGATYK